MSEDKGRLTRILTLIGLFCGTIGAVYGVAQLFIKPDPPDPTIEICKTDFLFLQEKTSDIFEAQFDTSSTVQHAINNLDASAKTLRCDSVVGIAKAIRVELVGIFDKKVAEENARRMLVVEQEKLKNIPQSNTAQLRVSRQKADSLKTVATASKTDASVQVMQLKKLDPRLIRRVIATPK